MEFFDEINSLDYLFLVGLKEPADNKLVIEVKEGTIGDSEEGLLIGKTEIGPVRSITFEGAGKTFNFYFESYISYAVLNESFTMLNEEEERIGRLFCIYSKSNFIDYVRVDSIAEIVMERQAKHFAINCLRHVINIVSFDDPIITLSE
jgi:hypothetical protein